MKKTSTGGILITGGHTGPQQTHPLHEQLEPQPPINSTTATHIFDLTELEIGLEGIVRHFKGDNAPIGRLVALGFTPGAAVKLERKNTHGSVLVSVRGTHVALGWDEACAIQISPREPEPVDVLPAAAASAVIALAGQPNVGKSTVFNQLTGLNQHVGNWTGKTVDLKMGAYTYQHTLFTLVDLPGTYSLTASSEEERITRDFILQEHPDLVVVVVDAATLERNLYLLAELLLLPAPIILALNMVDVAQQEGITIEPKVLETALGLPVVPMTASRRRGITELQDTIQCFLQHELPYEPKKPSILPAHRQVLDEIESLLDGNIPEDYPLEWAALKLLEGDSEITEWAKTHLPQPLWDRIQSLLYQHEDAILDIAGARYEWIARMVRAAVVEPQTTRAGFTARLDRVFTHPLWGTLIMLFFLGAVFWVTYTLGAPLQKGLSLMVSWLANALRQTLTGVIPTWMVELLAGGILGGVGMVLTFLPILAIFYTVLGFLEDTGYMARVAYLADRWMHSMGLHGKSFLPILLGFGCNVPAVYGTRIIESRPARLLTILLIPLIPCTARLAVVTILVPLFFIGAAAAWVAWGLIVLNILLMVLLGLTLHRFYLKNDHLPFIMELPIYHQPNLKTIGVYVWQNLMGFLDKAGKVILVATLVVWALSYFPTGHIQTSYLSMVGRALEPIGAMMGLPWPVLVALLTSAVAKENTISTLGVLYGNVNVALPLVLTVPAALAMLVFEMLFIPCVATVAAIRQETRSLKYTVISMAVMAGLAFGLGVLVYQMGTFIAR